jgi:hypothetical protein
METSIEITKGIGASVKVQIEVGKECLCFVWRVTVEEAQADAEEIVARMTR